MKKWFLLGMIICLQNQFCGADDFENLSKINVKGEASIFKPADQMEVSLGVVTSADDSTAAVEANNQHIRQMIANLRSLGLDETDYQTGRFHVKPVYEKPSKNSDPSLQGKISHYEALNTIEVKTQKIGLASQILNAAVEGGANQITQVNFNLNNPQAYRGEAIKIAAQNALADAHAAAEATDVKLKRILQISVDHWNNAPKGILFQARGKGSEEVFEPGQTEIHASVDITLEIGS